jgi:hypothetical protein
VILIVVEAEDFLLPFAYANVKFIFLQRELHLPYFIYDLCNINDSQRDDGGDSHRKMNCSECNVHVLMWCNDWY